MDRDRYLELSVERLMRSEFGDLPWIKKASQVAVYEVLDALRYNPAWLSGLGIGSDNP